MLIYFILVFSIYFLLVLSLIIGLLKKERTNPEANAKRESVSIVVAVRNEEENLPHLFASLENLDTSTFEVEIIFVDDHSNDHSSALIQEWINKHPDKNIHYFLSSGNGKKSALTTGIENAIGNIILTTDADCRLPSSWAHQMIASFDHSVNMVVGKVKIDAGDFFFAKLQALEFTSVMGTGTSFLAFGYPVMCNGASLAYRKEIFEAVNGYEGNIDVPSGDDEFLMRKIQARFTGSIRLVGGDVTVSTHPQPSLNRFIHQRLRWAGKWNRNDSVLAKALAFFILLVQLSTILLFAFLLAGNFSAEAIILLSAKIVLEGVFLVVAGRKLGQNFSLTAFILLQVIYPFYIVIIGILSQVAGYEWKGRSSG